MLERFVRFIVKWLLIAFAIYAVFTVPEKAADAVSMAWSILVEGFKAILVFFGALLEHIHT